MAPRSVASSIAPTWSSIARTAGSALGGVRSGRVSPGPGPSDPVRREHGLGEHGFPGKGQGGVVSLGHGGIRTLDLINIKDSELAVIVLQDNGTRLGLGKLGHRVPDFSDPGLVTRYQAEVLQPVEGRSSDSSPPSGGFRPSTWRSVRCSPCVVPASLTILIHEGPFKSG
jgi:hypothetical protein